MSGPRIVTCQYGRYPHQVDDECANVTDLAGLAPELIDACPTGPDGGCVALRHGAGDICMRFGCVYPGRSDG